MDFAKGKIIEALNSLGQNNVNFIRNNEAYDKNAQKSIDAREAGNLLFTNKKHNEKTHEDTWKLYTTSIAFAPLESEQLAAAFANRSAFLLHMKKYKEALLDIERVLKMTNCTSALKVKLFCRQAQCFVALQNGKQSGSLEKAKFWVDKISDGVEKSKLNKMIEKTQTVIENNESHYLEKEEIELNCKNDAVSVSYEKKLGRGLVATCDIQPGELVYIEKFHAVSVNKSKRHAYCSHCLGISWALIPCDHCAYYLYCSEKCKAQALEKYHDVECRMKCIDLFNNFSSYYIELGIRSLIMAIKEAGSIENLRKIVNEVDNCKDIKTKGFSDYGKLVSGFRIFCSFKGTTENFRTFATASLTAIAIQSLVQTTDIFGNKSHCNLHLTHNEDVVFVGSLLLRWIFTFMINAFSVQPVSEHCSASECFLECLEKNFCCSRGMGISLVTSLINHSCDNNVNKFYTNDGRVVYYATKPIKTNDQIFSSYYVDYSHLDKNSRQELLSICFEFHCNCVACQQDWPTADIIYKSDTPILYQCPAKYNKSVLEIMKRNNEIMTCLREKTRYKFSKKEIQSMAKDIAKIYDEKTQKPNLATVAFHSGFHYMMEKNYFDVLKVPSACN